MAEVIAVATDPTGRRYELSLKFDSGTDDALSHGDTRDRLQILLNREADRASQILFVAQRDMQEAAAAQERQRVADANGAKKGAKKPPAQVAFAGTDESIEVDAQGNEIARTKGGKRTLTKGAKG